MQRYGMTIPFDGVPLADQRDWIVELADLGYTDVWSSEANGADGFTPLALGVPRRGDSLSTQLPGPLVETPIRPRVLEEDELSFHAAMLA